MSVVILCGKRAGRCGGHGRVALRTCSTVRSPAKWGSPGPGGGEPKLQVDSRGDASVSLRAGPRSTSRLGVSRTSEEAREMGSKRKQRRQPHGAAWHWKQTDCWYCTQPGTKKGVPLFDEKGQRIRGRESTDLSHYNRHCFTLGTGGQAALHRQRDPKEAWLQRIAIVATCRFPPQ